MLNSFMAYFNMWKTKHPMKTPMFTFLHDREVPTHKGKTLLYNKEAKIQAKLSTLLKSFGQYLLADTISKR